MAQIPDGLVALMDQTHTAACRQAKAIFDSMGEEWHALLLEDAPSAIRQLDDAKLWRLASIFHVAIADFHVAAAESF